MYRDIFIFIYFNVYVSFLCDEDEDFFPNGDDDVGFSDVQWWNKSKKSAFAFSVCELWSFVFEWKHFVSLLQYIFTSSLEIAILFSRLSSAAICRRHSNEMRWFHFSRKLFKVTWKEEMSVFLTVKSIHIFTTTLEQKGWVKKNKRK